MSRFWLSMFFSAAVAASWAAKPTVENVSVSQDDDGRIVVSYDLVADTVSPEPGIVTVDFACGGEPVGVANYVHVWGDVNRKVACGTGKKIMWDAARDWSGHAAVSDGALAASVKVWATNAPPMYIAVDLVTADAVSYYASEAAVPYGVASDLYKTDRLLLRRIPAKGVVFRMGSPSSEAGRNANKENAFYATFSSDYYIGVYPLTQAQYYHLGVLLGWADGLTPSYFTASSGFAEDMRKPADSLSYNKLRGEDNNAATTDDEAYHWPQMGHAVSPSSLLAQWRGVTGLELDLPTEAQWEYACRAGTSGPVNVEGATLDEVAWHPGNSAVDGVRQTHPVGLKKPNAFGLYDMLGNVLEWCLDKDGTYPTVTDPAAAEKDYGGKQAGKSGNTRVRRGGCFGFENSEMQVGFDCRSAARWATYSVMCTDRNLGVRFCCPAGDATE